MIFGISSVAAGVVALVRLWFGLMWSGGSGVVGIALVRLWFGLVWSGGSGCGGDCSGKALVWFGVV